MTPPTTNALPNDIEAALKEYVIQYSAFVLNVGGFDVPKAEQQLRATISKHLAEAAAVRELDTYNLGVALETLKASDKVIATLRERAERLRRVVLEELGLEPDATKHLDTAAWSLEDGDLADDLLPQPGEEG